LARPLLPLLLALACSDVHPATAQLRAEEYARALGVKVDGITCHHCAGAGCHCELLSGERMFPLFCSDTSCEVRLR
jgi:hypothetical protein